MPDLYSIVEVKAEWMLQPETMGGKEKFWYRQPGEARTNWLFKYPRPSTGEYWAEKIVAEIAESLHIESPSMSFWTHLLATLTVITRTGDYSVDVLVTAGEVSWRPPSTMHLRLGGNFWMNAAIDCWQKIA